MDDPGPSTPITPRTGSGSRGRWQPPTVEHLQRMLGQFEVLQILGQGGMGAVYKGHQKALKRPVAIKILPLEAADDEMKFVERFKNEACTLAQMSHPGIVGVFDFGETSEGQLYFVMEYVDGTDVGQMIQASGRLPADHALRITTAVCDALSYAHSHGVIHRDIKPANILINREGQVKVADFGLAKMHDPAQTSALTRSNTAMGTPDYVAPEVLIPGMVTDHRADLYAVGVMLYQMLTGEVPRGMFKLPSQKVPEVDVRFDAIICKAMEQDRGERFQTALDVRRALDEIATTPLATNASTGMAVGSTTAARSRVVTAPERPEPVTQPIRRPRPLARSVLVASTVVTVLGAGGFFVLTGKKAPVVTPKVSDHSAIPSGPTIDWLQRDIWRTPWVLEQGVLKSTSKSALMRIGWMSDGIVRVRIRDAGIAANSGAPPLQLMLRYAPTAESTGNDGHYLFQFIPQKWSYGLIYLEKNRRDGSEKTEDLWSGKSLPAVKPGTKEFEFEVRANGDELSVWSAGLSVASIRDTRQRAGQFRIFADPGIEITKLETVGVTPNEVSTASTIALAPPAITNWADVTEAVRSQASTMPALIVEPDRIRRSGKGSAVPITLPQVGSRDYAIRIRHTGDAQIDLRSNPGGFLYVLCQSTQTIFQRYDHDVVKPGVLIPPVLHPRSFDINRPHDLLVTVQGSLIRAWLDGAFVAEARDATFEEGNARVMFVTPTQVHKVEVADLSSKAAMPDSQDWQDVTATVRENARAKPELIVEADAVRHAGNGGTVGIPLTRPGVRNYGVRVRYTESAQIDLRTNPTGFIYVYSRGKSKETLFHRNDQAVAAPVVLLSNQPHPADYDASKPHEFLVTMQGTALRAWLDGHFIGEAQEATFNDGTAELMFTKSSVIHKVEIAELSESPDNQAAQWQPVFTKPEDFGGRLDGVEFRDGSLFLKDNTVFAPTPSTDGAVRATMRFHDGRTGSLTIRADEEAPWGKESFACSAFISGSGTTAVLMVRDIQAKISEPVRHTFRLPNAIKEGDAFAIELRGENGQFVVMVNGRQAGVVEDSSAKAKRRFGIVPPLSEFGEFRDIAWQAKE